MKNIKVVAAIIIHDGMILCVQRGPSKYEYISGKWEFPGGKVEIGETKKNAIVREIKEELRMDIRVETFFTTTRHCYPDFNLTMHSFLCSCVNKDVTLTEHVAFKWLNKHELIELDWAGADVPIVEKLS